MYSTASTEFGFPSGPARAAFWSALLAWTVVLGTTLTSLTRARRVHDPWRHPSIGRSTSGGSSR
jgi:hypothetical protein